MLIIENVKKSYGDKLLFADINATISGQQRIGLIGVNGTGKSTLLKIIAGLEEPDVGEVQHPKAYTVAYLPQQPVFKEDETVLDYLFRGDTPVMRVLRDYEHALLKLEAAPEDEATQQGLFKAQQQMDKHEAWDANTTAKTILTKMGITAFHQNTQALSGGQQKRTAIAKALIQPADLLILDEPTNHLDDETIVWLEKYLASYPGALLVVTHDRYFLNRVTNEIFELDYGNLYRYEGNYEVFLEQKLEREELEQRLQQKHRNTLKQEIAWLKRGARARSTKQKARIERIDDMKKQTFHTDQAQVEIQTGSTRLGKQVIELEHATKTVGARTLFTDFNLLVTPGDRIGIIGPNGSGKSTLLHLIAGRTTPDEGEVHIGETVSFGYYTQGEEELDESLRIIEYIKETAEVIETKEGKWITAEQMLERFLFSRPKQWTAISGLSGGEKRRLYLLKILMQAPNVLMLDEPTNDLDIQTLGILEEYIHHFPGVVLTVSHDRYFLDQVADELLVFDGEGNIRHVYGNYSDYLAKQEEETDQRVKQQAAQAKAKVKTEKKKLSYHEQKEWDTIEEEITLLEEKLEAFQDEIAGQGSDFEAIQELYEKQQKVETALEEKMNRWEELSLLVESFEQNG